MAKRIENPADCESRAVIRFLQAKNIQPSDIHRQVCEVYGGAISDSMFRRWCRQFESGRGNVHDDKRSGCPSVVTPDFGKQQPYCSNFVGISWFTPPYSPDVAPSDYHLFLHMKRFLAGKQFHSDAEVETTVNNWLQQLAVDFFDTGIQKLVTRDNKCLDSAGDYVEK